MSKDLFEILVKNSLEGHKAQVPSGAWEAIKTQLPSAGAAAGPGVSAMNFGLGLVAGSTMLISLGIYSEVKDEVDSVNESVTEVIEQAAPVEVTESVVSDENTIQFDEAIALDEGTSETAIVNPDQEITGENNTIIENSIQGDLESVEEENVNTEMPPVVPMTMKDSNSLAHAQGTQPGVRIPANTNETDENQSTVPVDFIVAIDASVTEGYAPLTIDLNSTDQSAESFWYVEGIMEKSGAHTVVTFDEPGVYRVYLTSYNEAGEKAEDELEVVVREGSDILLPNIFTPNGDGLNDTYKVGYAKNIDQFYIRISDETGNVAFESNDLNAEWIYDNSMGIENRRFTVQYRAIGVDGKVHEGAFPLIIVFD